MYPVECECGATHPVPATAAGSRFECRCGRAVEVPSLARLKAAAGQPVLSPDLEIAHRAEAGTLPLGPACVACGRETDRQAVAAVVCETVSVESGETPVWQKLLVGLFTGVVLWRHQGRRAGVFGRDVRFALPVRLCDGCDPPAGRGERLRAALRQTPLYARLLDKYPAATVTPMPSAGN